MSLYSQVAMLAGLISLGLAIYVYYRSEKKFQQVYSELDEIESNIEDLKVTDRVYNQEEWDEEDLFEDNIMTLAKKLSSLLREKHNLDDVTTYSEMVDYLQELKVDDSEMKEELLNFYNKVIRIEYSERNLDQEEKRKLKEDAVDLIKKTGQSLGEPVQGSPVE